MKKEYTKPIMEIIKLTESAELLSGSDEPGNSGWAHENACAHGSHAPMV